MRDLDQTAHRDRSREEARRTDQERKYDRRLVVADGEEVQILLSAHDGPPVRKYLREAIAQPAHFVLFSVIEGDPFHVFPEADEIEAKIGFVALLIEVESDKRFANLVSEP